jgi:hypothetical protein
MKLTIYRDNTPTLQFQAFHDDGTVVDITGCTILMCAKADQSLPNTQALITKGTATSNLTITNPTQGIFQTTLTTLDTQSLIDTTVVDLDCIITDTSGNVFTIANTTTLEIKANFTRK